MINEHLHILHLNQTGDLKTDKICNERYGNLMGELIEQNITHYHIWDGFYDHKNVKQAISKGHHRIVQYAKDNNLPYIIVSEDDLKFTSPNSWRYFLSQIPESFDLFFGLIYSGNVVENRVMQGFSGGMTLYAISSRFYDTFLEQPTDTHVDRNLGNLCHLYEFKVIPEYCVEQRGGMSHNLRRDMTYEPYLIGKSMYEG